MWAKPRHLIKKGKEHRIKGILVGGHVFRVPLITHDNSGYWRKVRAWPDSIP